MIVKNFPENICQPIFISLHKQNIPILKGYGMEAVYLKISKLSKILMIFKSRFIHPTLLRWINIFNTMNSIEKYLEELNIDLLYFTSPSELPRFTDRFNFIYTVWDLCHRDEVVFPEIRECREFEQREEKYRTILPKAFAILVDSELTKEHVAHRYGIDDSKTLVMPFSPANKTDIDKNKYKDNFIHWFFSNFISNTWCE